MTIRHTKIRTRSLMSLGRMVVVLVLMTAGCIAMAYGIMIPVLQYVMPLLSFLLAWFLVSMPPRIVDNKALLVGMFLFLVGMGIYVYSRPPFLSEDNWPATKLLYPVITALGTFFPSRGTYDILYSAGDSAGTGYTSGIALVYYLYHYLSYFFLAWVGFSLFGRQLLNRVTGIMISYRRKNLFWGYSDGGYELAKDILRTDSDEEPVFLLDGGEDSDRDRNLKIINKLGDSSIIAFNVDFDRLLAGKHCIGAHRHFFLTEDQDLNVKLALAVLRNLKSRLDSLRYRTVLYVRSEQPGIDAFFQAEMGDDNRFFEKVGVRVFSQSDLTSRRFIAAHPILDFSHRKRPDGNPVIEIDHETCTVKGEISILMLGLGWTGFDMLAKIVADAAFGEDFRLQITVIDDDYRHNHGYYHAIVEEAYRHGVDIVLNPSVWVDENDNIKPPHTEGTRRRTLHRVNSALFYNWLADGDRILSFDRIIVALGDDELNINTALRLTRFRYGFIGGKYTEESMPEKIMAHVRDRNRYGYYTGQASSIITFGSIAHIYTVDVLIAEKLDTVAKLVNLLYSKKNDTILTPAQLRLAIGIKDRKDAPDQIGEVSKNEAFNEWNKLSIFNRDSSRAVALNVRNLITIAGGPDTFDERIDDEVFCDRLGRLEHLRWNAFHFMRGVKPLDIADAGRLKTNKLFFPGVGEPVRHACLVTYDNLDAVGNIMNKSYKLSDIKIVRHFNLFYKYLDAK